ncbi:HdeD family acid-resistance protein [Actinophytocola sp.]|uniref:HdeD family acid-resistance protein n=1 Tax=Actinophytocola sp. TaxID=1872138 RepID=UPI002ED9CA22
MPAPRTSWAELLIPDVYRTMMLRGAFAVVFGVLALIWPAATALVLALLFGVYALFNGVGNIVAAVRGDVVVPRWLVVVSGVASIVAGVIALVWPDITVLVLTLVVGAWALVTGVMEIAAAVRLRKVLDRRWPLVVTGVVSVIAGVLLLWHPIAGALGIAIVVGSYAVVYGVLLVSVAIWLRREVRRADGR